MCIKPYIPDTSGCIKDIIFRCIQKKNTSELHKNRQFRCIHPSKSINLSNPRCHILPPEANLRANHSEIHRNSPKPGNPDVSILPNPSKTFPIDQNDPSNPHPSPNPLIPQVKTMCYNRNAVKVWIINIGDIKTTCSTTTYSTTRQF